MRYHRLISFALGSSVALAASAMAAPAMNVSHGEAKSAPPPLGSTSYTAVVAPNGHLVRGKGATAAMQSEGTGTYEVDFVSDVTGCAYVATVGETGSRGSEQASFITVVGRSGVAAGVFVSTYDVNGNLKTLPFHIDVGC